MLDRFTRNLAIYVLICLTTAALFAQESKPQPPQQSNAVYKLEYVFSEVQNGKRINARSYSTLLHSGERGSIRLGSRLPVVTSQVSGATGALQYQYIDIGVNIDCRIERDLDSGIALLTNVDMSSV